MQTVLVINDSPEFLELMREFLSDEGYAPETHNGGEQVLERVKQVAPALIVLDLVLGQVDGWVILSRLLADDETRAIPVILCSAAAARTRRYAEELASTGVRILEKPFDLDHLLGLVVELIGPPHPPADDGPPPAEPAAAEPRILPGLA